MGLLKLGFVTIYLADPLISGFTTGAACHVFTSQVKYVLGIKVKRYNGALKLANVSCPTFVILIGHWSILHVWCGWISKLYCLTVKSIL